MTATRGRRVNVVLPVGMWIVLGGAIVGSCEGGDPNKTGLSRLMSPPLGLPGVPLPPDNPPTMEKIALGRKLFFDRRLSKNGTMSCGMCHIPEQGFTNNELATPVGVQGKSVKRNAPTILNAAYYRRLFLDGRATSLEEQAVKPLFADNEMGNESKQKLLTKLAKLSDYRGRFEKAFGGEPTIGRVGQAIASWERTLLAADSPFDRWRYGGQPKALGARPKHGFKLFTGKARCAQCHVVSATNTLFTDEQFHDTGTGYLRSQNQARRGGTVGIEIAPGHVVSTPRATVQQVGNAPLIDLGRQEATGRPEHKWHYRTPSLRNVEVTAPYMHDGSLATLDAVVRYYNRGGAVHPGLDPRIQPLGLNDREIACLVAFLRSLTAGNLKDLIADARSATP